MAKELPDNTKKKCPYCDEPLELHDNSFYYSQTGLLPTLVCTSNKCTRNGQCKGNLVYILDKNYKIWIGPDI